tara:strand:- start:557 stop:1387 length:831 start_codon:yes stop_codon:yes gene_type:complete
MALTKKASRPRTAKRRSAPAKKVPKQVKKYVKGQVDSANQIREKLLCEPNNIGTGGDYANYHFHAFPVVNTDTAGTTTDLMRLLPQIQQGRQRDQRDGSKIKLKNINCKFLFTLPETVSQSSAHSAVQCRLLVLSCKTVKNWDRLLTQWTQGLDLQNNYLRNGAESTRYKGDNFSLHYPVNTALFTTHLDKKFVLNRGHVEDTTNAHVPYPVKFINFNLKCKNKVIQYEDDDTKTAMNFNPFAILIYSYVSGTVETTTSTDKITGSCIVKANWKNM